MENINSMLHFLDRCQYRKDNKISGLCQKCQDKMFG